MLCEHKGIPSTSDLVGSGAIGIRDNWSKYGSIRIYDLVRWLSRDWSYKAQSIPSMEI